MWGIARFDLGISRREFRRLTPRQFSALHDRWREKERREDLRAGVQCAVSANFSMGKDPDRRALEPSDFFPSLAELEPEIMDDEQILASCELVRAQKVAGR